ncbi:hypothetical protein A3K63_03280 [Candidatus Micrarchaeota archaeon RBG_16_49_10]|nr:MAG: hypothetical protein A3K63_03280 [Candidatus Micrarchaeota archaeon RBG_16_49_10]
MDSKLKIHLVGIALIALVLIVGKLVSDPSKLTLTYVSSFGLLAFLSAIFVLSIPILSKVRKGGFTAALAENRKLIALYTLTFALIHVSLVLNFFFKWDLAKAAENPYRSLGGLALLVLAAVVLFSINRLSKALGKNWERIYYLLYAVLALIIVHSFKIGAIFMKSMAAKVAVGVLVALVVLGAILYRRIGK